MKTKEPNNETLYPECWEFFVEHARNIENEPGFKHRYRVPKPDMSGDFIYHNHVGGLFHLLKEEWYKPSLNSPSVHGKIQYIVQNF